MMMMMMMMHGTPAAAVNQTLWRGTRNVITEFSQKMPPIFGWAAITLGIGPHSGIKYFATLAYKIQNYA